MTVDNRTMFLNNDRVNSTEGRGIIKGSYQNEYVVMLDDQNNTFGDQFVSMPEQSLTSLYVVQVQLHGAFSDDLFLHMTETCLTCNVLNSAEFSTVELAEHAYTTYAENNESQMRFVRGFNVIRSCSRLE